MKIFERFGSAGVGYRWKMGIIALETPVVTKQMIQSLRASCERTEINGRYADRFREDFSRAGIPCA